mgnify:CR=1 FL=1
MLERVKAEANQWVRQLGSDLKFALSQLARFLLGGVKLPRFIWHQVRRREIRKEVVHAALFLVVLHLAGTVTQEPLADLIDALGSAFGLMLGMTGSCALALLISIISSVSVVST